MTERENSAENPAAGGAEPAANAESESSAASSSAAAADRTAPGVSTAGALAQSTEAEEPQNRRARRAAAARARKARTQERAEAEAIGLDAQEMIDEAFTRGTAKASRWLRNNAGLLQGILAAGIIGWAGWGLYSWRVEVSRAQASDVLAEALRVNGGEIGDPEKQGQENEQGIIDPTPIYKDAAERQKAAKQAFEKASQQRAGSPAAAYAELGLAATLYDAQQYDEALRHYEALKNSPTAKTDAELRGRALEGNALVLEAKKDLPGALKAYRELAQSGIRGFDLLGLYGQTRLQHATGDDAAARQSVTELNERLSKQAGAGADPFAAPGYLKQAAKLLSDTLGVVPPAPSGGEPKGITPEQLKALQQQVQEQINKAGQKGSNDGQ